MRILFLNLRTEKISLSRDMAAVKGKEDLQFSRGRGRAWGEKPSKAVDLEKIFATYKQNKTKKVIAIKYKELLQINNSAIEK